MHNEPTLLLLGGNVSIIIDTTNINIQNLFVQVLQKHKKVTWFCFHSFEKVTK